MHEHPEKYKSLVVRVGGFHIAENFLGSIGFLMKESGIEDITAKVVFAKEALQTRLLQGKTTTRCLVVTV